MKNSIFTICKAMVLTALAVLFGDNGVIMAAATDFDPTATGGVDPVGKGTSGEGSVTGSGSYNTVKPEKNGIASDTENREFGDDDYLSKEIDRKITKIRPMSTPIDQISRMADSSKTKQMDFKYFSIGTRPIKTTLSTAVTAQTASAGVVSYATFTVANPAMFTVDDTIRVVDIPAVTRYEDKYQYQSTDTNVPDLILKVVKVNDDGTLTVHAINGVKATDGQPVLLPAIAANTVLIRLGKACGELDVQTGRFANTPVAETQYCQNFMMQVEESTFNELSEKNVDWNFTDMEEDSVYDMRLGMEGSFLFGDKSCIQHTTKNGMNTWFTGGIWWMAGHDVPVGHVEGSEVVVDDDDLVDICKDLFVGTGSGTKRKVLLCGSDLLAALSKIKSEKFRLKDTVEVWDLKFKSWDTDFGEVLTMHHELFDLNGMSDCGLAIDPEYLSKKQFISWNRSVLDLKKAGIRNTNAVVLQEASALYLRYPKAHARMKLVEVTTSAS